MLNLNTGRPIRSPNSIDFRPIDMITKGADGKKDSEKERCGYMGLRDAIIYGSEMRVRIK